MQFPVTIACINNNYGLKLANQSGRASERSAAGQ